MVDADVHLLSVVIALLLLKAIGLTFEQFKLKTLWVIEYLIIL